MSTRSTKTGALTQVHSPPTERHTDSITRERPAPVRPLEMGDLTHAVAEWAKAYRMRYQTDYGLYPEGAHDALRRTERDLLDVTVRLGLGS